MLEHPARPAVLGVIFTAKLNDESHDILVERRKARAGQLRTSFALVFMGDTHIQMCGPGNEQNYRRVLRKARKENRLIAIFHGGDGAHVNDDHYLLAFRTATRQELFGAKQRKDRVPLFMNVGNHEYIGSGSNPIAHYNSLVGNAGQIQTYRLTPNDQKVILEVILIDTGGPAPNGFPAQKASLFKKQVDAIDRFIRNERQFYSSRGQSVRFIIDMHIPPAVGVLGKKPVPPSKPHYLNKISNKQFLTMVSKHPGQIVAIVTHHRHCTALKDNYKKTPVFITTHAGQTTGCVPTRLEYLRLRLRTTAAGYQITSHKFVNA